MRRQAVQLATSRKPKVVKQPEQKFPDYFGANVFGDAAMQNYLNKEAIKAIQNARNSGEKISRNIASSIAEGMKRWALDQGVTHFTHWFQPLTGSTAEKHDSFLNPDGEKAMATFSADELVQQEPDASSLPSGGLRNTFEARGYTAWDPTSPAFIFENTSGKTLCIPTIFVSYTGEALDYKAPLIKALNLLDKAAVDVCKYFDKKVSRVKATLGWEQEYFLVDKALYFARTDLVLAKRSVYGFTPAKGQQLDDHYFGKIPDRVFNFMYELEIEAHKLGIPIRTRHNEVAPGQYEFAPMFEEANLAVDHNQLFMDLIYETAEKHDFIALFHEKPFAGLNGSGKHCNWSMATNTGVNLLSPGKNPSDNLQFLTFFINSIKAVHDHANLIRASIASAGNDHRLGANEAPPAIISIFIGSTLTNLLAEFEKNQINKKSDNPESILVHNIPEILVDNTDRNRTSPFAFTGNKFELRAVGSSASCAGPMTILNTIMANQLVEFKSKVDAKIKNGNTKKIALIETLREEIKASKKILFEGNGYGEYWVKEAKNRGLENKTTTPLALEALESKNAHEVLVKNNIFTKEELEARLEINLEAYILQLQIEGRTITDIARTQIIPAVNKYQNELASTSIALKQAGVNASSNLKILETITQHADAINEKVNKMEKKRAKANTLEKNKEKAHFYASEVLPYYEEIRNHVDELERLIDDEKWPLPKYRELIFVR